MKVVETCPICEKACRCECNARALLAYLDLLKGVHNRVSTQELTSVARINASSRACIDKISFHLQTALSQVELIQRLKHANLGFRQKRLRDKKWYLEVGNGEQSLYFYLGHPQNQQIYKVISRPSAFNKTQSYWNFLRKVLREDEINLAKTVRIDLAIDYKTHFPEITRGLDVHWKRLRIQYVESGKSRTGLQVGGNNEKFVIYDKSIESNIAEPLTRIEAQLSGKKLPIRQLSQLPLLKERLLTRNPFSAIKLNRISFSDSNLFTPKTSEKLSELKTLIEHEGLLSARTKLNQNRNFERDYRHFFNLDEMKPTPAESLIEFLKCDTFFSTPNQGDKDGNY